MVQCGAPAAVEVVAAKAHISAVEAVVVGVVEGESWGDPESGFCGMCRPVGVYIDYTSAHLPN